MLYFVPSCKSCQKNFKAVSQLQAELHLLKVEKLDECIRPLFANNVLHGLFLSHILNYKTQLEVVAVFIPPHKYNQLSLRIQKQKPSVIFLQHMIKIKTLEEQNSNSSIKNDDV